MKFPGATRPLGTHQAHNFRLNERMGLFPSIEDNDATVTPLTLGPMNLRSIRAEIVRDGRKTGISHKWFSAAE